MSNIYIQEPPTSGKVLLKTSVGDIDLELWTREAPKACRNFIQLCMEGYYNGTIFHRLVKGFIVQGGDPSGTGEKGESIYGQPFKDEFHTRLRFCRRGLLAMANAGKDDNGSQFFFTLGATPELQNKHTIFGKVTGETLYNMLKLAEAEIDQNERPLYPQKIIKTEVLLNPFEDIVPRCQPKGPQEVKEIKKDNRSRVKNFKLLSFGEEAEDDEEKSIVINQQFIGKSKSAHDNLADPKLSSAVAIEPITPINERIMNDPNSDWESDEDDSTAEERAEKTKKTEEMKVRIVEKLKVKKAPNTITKEVINCDEADNHASSEDDYYLGKDRDDERKKQAKAIRKEIRDLKRDVQKNKKNKKSHDTQELQKEEKKIETSEIINDYSMKAQKIYKVAAANIPKKGVTREKFTLEMVKKFQNKLQNARQSTDNLENSSKKHEKDIEDTNDETWMTQSLQCEDNNPILAKDASTKNDNWFEIYDPRNPINKRRRGEKTEKKNKRVSEDRNNFRFK